MFKLPNLFTLANLITGSVGILMTVLHGPQVSLHYVLIGVIFDFFDGFTARKLKMTSPIGKELDSLADMVTFGVLPGLGMYFMIAEASENMYLPYVAFLLIAFSALRLAKFNVDERQSDTFYGLATPANALFITSLAFLELRWVHHPLVLTGLSLVFSILLIADIRMFAFKFKNFGWKDNKWKFLAIALAFFAVIWKGVGSIPFIVLGYIIFSFVNIWLPKRNN